MNLSYEILVVTVKDSAIQTDAGAGRSIRSAMRCAIPNLKTIMDSVIA